MHTSGDPALPWGNDSQYNVPSRDRVPFAYRLGVLSDLLFMFRILKRVVAPARRLAVKGNYGQAPMIRDSVETLRVIEEVGIGVHIDGLEHMQSLGGPAVVTANHMSILDTFVTPCMIAPYCKVCYVAKDALGRGFFGPIMRSLDPILVERQDPRADFKTVMNEGLERIARGYSVMVFPQSTRMVRFDPEQFNTLGEKLARKAGVPVVPLAIKSDVYVPGRFIRELGHVQPEKELHLAFGPAVDSSLPAKEVHARVVAFITERLRGWGVEVAAEKIEKPAVRSVSEE